MPYLIYLLAHHPDFDQDEEDKPTFQKYLTFFLEPLIANTKEFQYIFKLFSSMAYAKDFSEDEIRRSIW